MVLTIVTGENPLGQEEAAELVLSVGRDLDLHQVRRHAERIVLQVAFALGTATGDHKKVHTTSGRHGLQSSEAYLHSPRKN